MAPTSCRHFWVMTWWWRIMKSGNRKCSNDSKQEAECHDAGPS